MSCYLYSGCLYNGMRSCHLLRDTMSRLVTHLRLRKPFMEYELVAVVVIARPCPASAICITDLCILLSSVACNLRRMCLGYTALASKGVSVVERLKCDSSLCNIVVYQILLAEILSVRTLPISWRITIGRSVSHFCGSSIAVFEGLIVKGSEERPKSRERSSNNAHCELDTKIQSLCVTINWEDSSGRDTHSCHIQYSASHV